MAGFRLIGGDTMCLPDSMFHDDGASASASTGDDTASSGSMMMVVVVMLAVMMVGMTVYAMKNKNKDNNLPIAHAYANPAYEAAQQPAGGGGNGGGVMGMAGNNYDATRDTTTTAGAADYMDVNAKLGESDSDDLEEEMNC
jgi:hypothetical protein